MKKGDVWLVEIPSSNGHEQIGLRPCIVIADTMANVCVIIPITSNSAAARFSHTIRIKPSIDNGLIKESVALLFQMRAIDKKRLKRKIGFIEETDKIDRLLKVLLKL